jgi:integrase
MPSNKRAKRTRIGVGLSADKYGISIRVRGKEHRYPLGTPLDELRRNRRELLASLPGTEPRRGTFAQDVATYLATLPDGNRRRDAASLLQHWLDAGFGIKTRHTITAIEIQQQLQKWAGRFKPAGLRHLRRELGALYRALNGKAGANPVRDVPQIAVRYDEPRDIPYQVIETILSALPDQGRPKKGDKRPTVSLTKIRLTIMAYSGFTPAILMRIQARDLHLTEGTVYARPRRKGAGSPGQMQPLTPQALAGFRQLIALGGLGRFSTGSVSASWNRAIGKARQQWEDLHPDQPWPVPDDCRPYDLRHSYATAVLRASGSERAVSALLMHTQAQTTRRYTQGMVREESLAAVAALTASLQQRSSQTLPTPAPKLAKNARQWRKQDGKGGSQD